MIEKLMTAMARNGSIVFFRLLGVAMLIIGIVTAALGVSWKGLTPIFFVLLAFASFLGVICHTLFRIVLDLENKARG